MIDDKKFLPDQTVNDLPTHQYNPREMTAEEMADTLGNAVRELMVIEKSFLVPGWRLYLGCVEVAHIGPQECEGYAEDLAHAIAGSGRMIDRLSTEVKQLRIALDEVARLKRELRWLFYAQINSLGEKLWERLVDDNFVRIKRIRNILEEGRD